MPRAGTCVPRNGSASGRCGRSHGTVGWATPPWNLICFGIAPEAGSGDPYTHEGEEFIFVLRGDLEIALDGEQYRLKPGDSFYFESATPHRWKKSGPQRDVVLWVNTPPTF